MEVFRRLDVTERYLLAKENANGYPHMCTLATFKVQNDDGKEVKQIESMVQDRLSFMLKSVPHLSFFIDEPRSLFPRYVRFKGKEAFDVREILIDQTIEWDIKDEEDQTIEQQHTKMQMRLLEWQKDNVFLEHGKPLWNVQLIRADPKSPFITVALTISHILNDGRGMINMLSLMVAPSHMNQELIDPIKLCGTYAAKHTCSPADFEIAPAKKQLPKARNMKWLLNFILSYFMSKWEWFGKYFGLLAFWPSKVISTKPFFPPGSGAGAACVSSHVIMLRGTGLKSVLAELREGCRMNGNASIHSAIHTASLIALKATIRADPGYKNQILPLDPIVQTNTSMSVREDEKCGTMMGNYVGLYKPKLRLPRMNETLFSITNKYSTAIRNPTTRKKSAQFLIAIGSEGGMCSDEKLQEAYPKTKNNPHGPTLWEYIVNAKANGARINKPVTSSLEISNPGKLSALDGRIVGVSWKQTNSLSFAINVDVCQWEIKERSEKEWQTDDEKMDLVKDGMAISVGFHNGIFTDDHQEKVFVQYMRKSMELLLAKRWTKDLKVKDVFSAVQEDLEGRSSITAPH